jgi:hypothetical protein
MGFMNISVRSLSWISTAVLLALVISLQPLLAAVPPAQQHFPSPDEAMKALISASKEGSKVNVARILGPDSGDILDTGDPVADANRLAKFEARCGEKLTIETKDKTTAVALIGNENWPFPIPIVKEKNGWVFDTATGREEIINRFVGKNELKAIETCRRYVEAQRAYVQKDWNGDGVLEYARKVVSEKGKKDGLYWKQVPGEAPCPLADLSEAAKAEGYSPRARKVGQPSSPYHGYHFRILTRQGPGAPGGSLDYVAGEHMTKGFAMLAYPAKWGVSGIMTFLVNQTGTVLQKDLGKDTDHLVKWIESYNPDASWAEYK